MARTIQQVRQSDLLITEALHGAVVADALRVPWISVRAYGHILPFKWHDWCESLGLRYEPQRLPTLWQKPLPVVDRARLVAKRICGYLPGGKEKWRFSPVRVHGRRRIDEAATALVNVAANSRGHLSADATHQLVLDRLTEKLEMLRRNYGKSAPQSNAA